MVSVGHIAAGDLDAHNIIPAEAVVCGTSRSYKAEVRNLVKRREGARPGLRGDLRLPAEVGYDQRYPALVTHAEQTDVSLAAARALAGESKVIADAPLVTGSEDFAFMLEARPGGFMLIGNGVEADGGARQLHTPDYDFNDEILTLGSAYWVCLAHEELD